MGAGRFSQERSDLKTWPATTRSFRSGSGGKARTACGLQVGVASLREAAGVGQPFADGILKFEI